MSDCTKNCYTCRKSDSNKFYNLYDCDSDKVCYLDKLRSCIFTDLIITDNMEMCSLCIRHLRSACKFRETVLLSQQYLRNKDNSNDVKPKIEAEEHKVLEYIKSEDSDSDSDFEEINCKAELLTDDFPTTNDLMQTVNALTKQLQESQSTKKHKRKPSKPLNLMCEFCGTEFTKKWQLKKHMSRVHSDTRKFLCTYCDKEFKQSCHLKEHITSHTGEKNYTCPICDKKFQRMSSQRRHIKSHDAPPGCKTKRTPFLCTICGKSFPFSNGVQRHMRIHLGIKNFECDLCHRRFTQSTHLQVHMRTHTGEKPYICDTCGEKFSLKSCMLKHINTRHCASKNFALEFPIVYLNKDYEQVQL